MLTRPALDEMFAYRRHVDAAMLDAWDGFTDRQRTLAELGIQHEQQHQELILTDLLHLFALNPLRPAYAPRERAPERAPAPLEWVEHPGGIRRVGHHGPGFAFDCEQPAHQQDIGRASCRERVGPSV